MLMDMKWDSCVGEVDGFLECAHKKGEWGLVCCGGSVCKVLVLSDMNAHHQENDRSDSSLVRTNTICVDPFATQRRAQPG